MIHKDLLDQAKKIIDQYNGFSAPFLQQKMKISGETANEICDLLDPPKPFNFEEFLKSRKNKEIF